MQDLSQHNITNNDKLQEVVVFKSDFELAREFTFWNTEDDFEALEIIANELNKRRKKISIIIFIPIALLTNSLFFIVDNLYGFRWLYFEETKLEMIRQYFAGIIFWTLFPLIIGISCIIKNESLYIVKIISILSFG